ncbi:MAG: Lrp/AsnC family transcriptional regulator [Aliivibrio sp.]|uniref:Lrp/AsnC family transcriptional regulator n=1 Tax=Aliivibrio sp. TaxID=1872443 RepID=UPI001A5FAA97|nr:Lrp/AsnC family transcriptional regulator [Aliivibrio sp.]
MFLDRTDKAILRFLQKDSSVSNLQLSFAIGLSPPACLKRVKRLKKEGVISREVALINQEKLGPCLHIIMNIEMERDRLDLNKAFINKMKIAPEVKQCYQVTGDTDFILLVTVADIQSYEAFCKKEIYSETNMKNFRTHISMNRVKFETSVLIE